jgi:hypothetical protein
MLKHYTNYYRTIKCMKNHVKKLMEEGFTLQLNMGSNEMNSFFLSNPNGKNCISN